ncbi:MAG: hypothetical protein PHZ00_04260, partial [Candidatus Peribacteraceae bacterium]|nr:hypothetical protein [Candidatus Peribacteraceae bacterium]
DEPTVCVMKNICGSKCSLACFLNFDHEKECQISLPTRLPEEAPRYRGSASSEEGKKERRQKGKMYGFLPCCPFAMLTLYALVHCPETCATQH